MDEIDQTNRITQESIQNATNELSKSLKVDMETNLINVFQKATDTAGSIAASQSKMPEMMAMGSAGLKSLTGGAGKVFQGGIGMGMGIGNSTSMDQKLNNDLEFKNEFGITDETIIDDEDIKENDVKESLSTENINDMVNEVLQANGIELSLQQCLSDIKITNIQQLNEANMKVESTTINTVSTEITSKLMTNIKKILQSVATKSPPRSHEKVLQALATGANVAGGGMYVDAETMKESVHMDLMTSKT